MRNKRRLPKMRLSKRLSALAGALALCCALALPAYAHDVPDGTRTGSIQFMMTYNKQPVGGGTLTLYHVGDVAEDDGNYSFALSDAYEDCGASLEDISDNKLADTLADYTTDHNLQGINVKISSDGTVTADDLTLGLYLVMQHNAASGYQPIAPFLVSVPYYDAEQDLYLYEVDAAPKMAELVKVPPTSSQGGDPTTTTTTTVTINEAAVAQTTLPQTGQLNWPVPALTVAGLLLLLVGWYLRSKQGKSYAA